MFSRKRNTDDDFNTSNKWLKRLQQESWELELLVSGFSILLLFKAGDFLSDSSQTIKLFLNTTVPLASLAEVFINILLMALWALIVNLTIHLLLRGFWVGIVGLGSVAPNTDIEKLKFSPFFTEKLKNKIGDLEKLVVFLDNISSLIFAFAFLVIFLLLSVGLFVGGVLLVSGVFNFIIENTPLVLGNIIEFIAIIILGAYLILGIVYFIDFVSLGLIKKIKRTARWYYPIYVFFGWITLAQLYRIIYYNLLSRFSKKNVAFVLVSYLVLMVAIPSLYMDHALYFDKSEPEFYLSQNYYTDTRNSDAIIEKIDIPSRIISSSYLPLFVRYDIIDNDLIKKRFKDFEPTKEEKLASSFKFYIGSRGVQIGFGDRVKEENPEKALNCLKEFYNIYIDDAKIEAQSVYFATHSNKGEPGLQMMLDIDTLTRGVHFIEVKKEVLKDSMLVETDYVKAPFWKE